MSPTPLGLPSAFAPPPFAGAPDLGCRDAEPEIFFPEGNEDADQAKWFCRRCNYRWECLEFALADDKSIGVWGGATAKERRKILAERGTA